MDEQLNRKRGRRKMYRTGIYLIRCSVNGKTYVGAAVNITNRFTWHRHYLRRNIHPNKYLQTDFNSFGETSFDFITHFLCPKDQLSFFENEFINELGSSIDANGYNILTGGTFGRKVHQITREKLSKTLKAIGYKPSKEIHERSLQSIRKTVINNETGRIYESVVAAANDLNIKENTLRGWLKNRCAKKIDIAFI